MDNLLYKLADEYIHFEIENKVISVPYAISGKVFNMLTEDGQEGTNITKRFKNYAGKGTPKQVRKCLVQKAKKKSINLKSSYPQEIKQFMQMEGIGVDCSGFVFNVLNEYLKITKHKTLNSIIHRYKGLYGFFDNFLLRVNGVRRCNATTLTSDLNTIKINKVSEIQLADVIRFTHKGWAGKHVGIIVDVTNDYITYAMSSDYTKENGAHYGKILIINNDNGLEEQKWEELTKEGNNYGLDAFIPARGDSVRRLRFLQNTA